MWITNGEQADWACVLLNTDSNEKNMHKNKSLVCVPLNLPGVHKSVPLAKLGMQSSDTVQLFFEDVRVSARNYFFFLNFFPGPILVHNRRRRSWLHIPNDSIQ